MKDNDFECHECKGKGTVNITYVMDGKEFAKSENILCISCNGSGRVDWIKHAMKNNKTMNSLELSSLFEHQNF